MTENTRKKRVVITLDICKNVRRYLEMEKSLKEISRLTEVSYNSILTIVNKMEQGLDNNQIATTKKGRKKNNESLMKSRLAAIVNEDNSLTQSGMAETLQLYGIKRSQVTISRTLKSMSITRKRLTKIPIERNSDRVIGLRQAYAREMQNYCATQIVYLDETGFNLHTSSNYGYSPKNVKAIATIPANKGVNISLLAAIDVNGIISHEISDGAYNAYKFISFINKNLVPYFEIHPNSILVMDNCRFHHSVDVIKCLGSHKINYHFLPPYSPQLNPIEEFFSELKSNYKVIRPLSKNRDMIKSRVTTLLQNRNGNFLLIFERAKNFLLQASARHPFI